MNLHSILQDTFLGEIVGAVVLTDRHSSTLNPEFVMKPIKVLAEGVESNDGEILVNEKHGRLVKILQNVDENTLHHLYTHRLVEQSQSAKVGSFAQQKRKWSHPIPHRT